MRDLSLCVLILLSLCSCRGAASIAGEARQGPITLEVWPIVPAGLESATAEVLFSTMPIDNATMLRVFKLNAITAGSYVDASGIDHSIWPAMLVRKVPLVLLLEPGHRYKITCILRPSWESKSLVDALVLTKVREFARGEAGRTECLEMDMTSSEVHCIYECLSVGGVGRAPVAISDWVRGRRFRE